MRSITNGSRVPYSYIDRHFWGTTRILQYVERGCGNVVSIGDHAASFEILSMIALHTLWQLPIPYYSGSRSSTSHWFHVMCKTLKNATVYTPMPISHHQSMPASQQCYSSPLTSNPSSSSKFLITVPRNPRRSTDGTGTPLAPCSFAIRFVAEPEALLILEHPRSHSI